MNSAQKVYKLPPLQKNMNSKKISSTFRQGAAVSTVVRIVLILLLVIVLMYSVVHLLGKLIPPNT